LSRGLKTRGGRRYGTWDGKIRAEDQVVSRLRLRIEQAAAGSLDLFEQLGEVLRRPGAGEHLGLHHSLASGRRNRFGIRLENWNSEQLIVVGRLLAWRDLQPSGIRIQNHGPSTHPERSQVSLPPVSPYLNLFTSRQQVLLRDF
jgi:hypothetical protein